ncbi:hypothetical protein OIU93_19970 [Paeniglutamicibacter sp. ZC-3]|uniref:hypothetical protein n=1 Tax=Paeniglutamicibacter sp. ZC-3 TaxID=2986919 RepID=UPI0021F70305|nr:hypothetical protein [Paeniglutamicibacter sp. ZC-3]MCV9996545.1 hypothetical protein [Paeniglutamicibacter sp. ZC-3]
MTKTMHLFEEHNSACERARLSSCNCYCHGAGHQFDLIKRAVSCSAAGDNNLAQLRDDLHDVYGGFHQNLRDATTPSRRKIEGVENVPLDRGRGATWVETLLVDEGLHAAFIQIANSSVALSDADREMRVDFVEQLTDGAFRIVGGDVETHNICDGHLWCSIVSEASAYLPSIPDSIPSSSGHGKIAYPRESRARIPRNLAGVRSPGVSHVGTILGNFVALAGKEEILRLMGAAACPDLWHHPAAVRYLLYPFVNQLGWPTKETTTLAVKPGIGILESRWDKRGNW